MSLKELEQEPFDSEEFVGRLAWKVMGLDVRGSPENFDPMQLHAAFEKTIGELTDMNKKLQLKVDKLEAECSSEEIKHWQRVGELQKSNQVSYSHFQELHERINFVATKVVHLGDQLEGVNTPRARAVEAQRLMNYFSEFLTDAPLKSAVFTDPFQLQIAADIIQKLFLVSQELPSGPIFEDARKRIAEKYNHIEKELIEEFRIAHHELDKRKMKRVALVLSNFKGYGKCINAFIDESQKGAFLKEDIYSEVIPLCKRTCELINEVFASPESVTSRLIQSIYSGKLQQNISKQLDNKTDSDKYLPDLYNLYAKTNALSNELSQSKLIGNDTPLMAKLTKQIFSTYLDSYITREMAYLNERCSSILQRFYDSKGHQKKLIQSGGIHDLRRDIQAKIGTVTTKANLNIGPVIENYGGETFLSQEVALNLLEETKTALMRCKVLSSHVELPNNAMKIFEALVQYLVTEHIDYAIELGLQCVPLPDSKVAPEVYFFETVGQANSLFHLVEKQFNDHLVPLVLSSPRHTDCLQIKRGLIEHMEAKTDLGLDRSLTAITGWVRHTLSTEQKKTDFKPEGDDAVISMKSQACASVVAFLDDQLKSIKRTIDGKNVEAVLTDLGTRFHRLIFDHLQQFQYNSIGAMLVICDINEYRRCMKECDIAIITQLFEKLHALCNLLVVMPEKLKSVISDEQLIGIDKSVMQNFLQLRADYKISRISSFIK